MSWISLCACAAIAAIAAAVPCRADLFAVLSTTPEILRIDSATGAVTHTYPFPDPIIASPSPSIGLAFDGRGLYMSRVGSFFPSEVWRYDLVNNFWLGPTMPDTFVPSGEPQLLTGLGYQRGQFGFGNIIGVSRPLSTNTPPSHIFSYLADPFSPDPFFFNTNLPPGELPSNFVAQGADVDPANGDLWIAAEEIVGQMRIPRLLRTDLAGNELETLTPGVDPATILRGVGFDAGAMFVAARHLPTSSNHVYEINRNTGAVLRSFELTGAGVVGGLAGGVVLPEPGAALLALFALCGLAQLHRCRR